MNLGVHCNMNGLCKTTEKQCGGNTERNTCVNQVTTLILLRMPARISPMLAMAKLTLNRRMQAMNDELTHDAFIPTVHDAAAH